MEFEMVRWTSRIICWTALSLAGLFSAPGIGRAVDFSDCEFSGESRGTDRLNMPLADLFQRRPRPSLGATQSLERGVSWRLVTDTRTGVALPRIIDMPDRDAMKKANRLLDAEHECLVLYYESLDGRRKAIGYTEAGPRPFFQPDLSLVRLTYASRRLVSYVDMLVLANGPSNFYVEPRAAIIDLQKGRIYESGLCHEGRDNPSTEWSVFDNFLQVCDFESRSKFFDIWSKKVEEINKAASLAPDNCERRMGYLDAAFTMSAYLTNEGFAFYDFGRLRGVPEFCLDAKKSLIAPIVISYRELAPFMKRGPWRDELLKLPASKP